jgi:hypothetical protein
VHALAIPVALAIPTRHTNRRPFDDVAVGPAEQRAAQVALKERSWLQVIADPTSAGRGSSCPPGRIASNSPDRGLRRRARPLDEHQP